MSNPAHIALMEAVARHFFGEPNAQLSKNSELRFGTRGSKSVNLKQGVWFDHEAGEGGGPLDLIMREVHLTEPRECYAWAEHQGFWSNGGGPSPGRSKVVTEYDYRDEGGALLYQKCRWEPGAPQRFTLRRPDGKGGWINKLGNVRRVVYRLPEAVETISMDRTIFLVEGEKDVDNCWRIGVPATCNFEGAGKWSGQQTETFKGADVVAITDNDEPGRKHGNLIAAKLSGVAKKLRVFDIAALWPQCPPKGDISNWIEVTHGTAEQFYAVIAQAKGGGGAGGGALDKKRRDDLAKLNEEHCVVLDGAKAWVLHFETITHKVDDYYSYSYKVPVFLRKSDFRTMYENRFKRRGPDFVDLGKWWLQHSKRRQFFGVVYEPGSPQVVDDGRGKLKLNLWTGWGVEPKPGDWSLMRTHIRKVLAAGDESVDAYIMNWLAWRVQHPDRRPETALVFLGKPGSGRGTLGVALCRIFGNHALHLSSPDHLVGRFNAHQRQCSFLFSDEAYTVEDRAAAGRLKRLITEPTLSIEGKGKDVMPAQNRLAVMMASNEEQVIPAGEWERRYVVQRVCNDHAQDTVWFDPLHRQLNSGGLEAMLFDLLRYELGKRHPRQIIRTAALAEQQEQSLSPLDAWWIEILQTGLLPAGNDAGEVISGDYDMKKMTKDGYDRTERRKGLYTQAREWSPGLKWVTDATFGHYLSNKEKVGAKRAWVARQRGWKLPTLERCRAEWSKRFPDTKWDEDTASWQGERAANWSNGGAETGRQEPEGGDDDPSF